jgi:hypothetical protein
MENYGELSLHDRQALGLEYFKRGIHCPFLVEGACSIHFDRPLACREYLLTSTAADCASPRLETVHMITIPIKVSVSAGKLGRSKERPTLSCIPMIRALEFPREFPENKTLHTGQEWIGELFQGLTGNNPNH